MYLTGLRGIPRGPVSLSTGGRMHVLAKHLVWALLLMFAPTLLLAQRSSVRSAVTMGTRYVVAFPKVWPFETEKPLPKSTMILMSSPTKTKVTVRSLAVAPTAPPIDRTITLEQHKVYKFDVHAQYEASTPGKIVGGGIEVLADVPISVSTYQAWNGNGEQTLHLPVLAWGTKYLTHNFYLDRFGSTNELQYRPSQVIIVAQADTTVVSYTPMIRTQGGPDVPSTPAGATQRITLHRGQTFLLQDAIVEADVRTWRSDLSGTQITSTKPIAVISGHTKAAIMRMPDVLPPSGPSSSAASFVRSNIHETMLPVDRAGTSFMTVPAMYTPTRVLQPGFPQYGMDPDSGDVIRVMATVDGTIVYRRRIGVDDASVAVATLRAGASYLDTMAVTPTAWTTSAPVLVTQYMKSYAKLILSSVDQQPHETTALPAVEGGQPSMCLVPPLERGITYGTFWSAEGMDNFFSIVYKTEHTDRIRFDGVPLSAAFGTSGRQLDGTAYSYVRMAIGAGDHRVESDADSIRWVAWTYGSLDGLQQGRAYSTTLGVDLAMPCTDTLRVLAQDSCGDVRGILRFNNDIPSCGRMVESGFRDIINYATTLDSNTASDATRSSFSLRVLDRSVRASARLRATTLSGDLIDTVFTYIPDTLVASDSSVMLTWRTLDTTVCGSFTVTNPTRRTMRIDSMLLARFRRLATFDPPSMLLAPGASQVVQACVTIDRFLTIKDTIKLRTACRDIPLLQMQIQHYGPAMVAGDQTWQQIPQDNPGSRKRVEIRNVGQTDLTISDYDRTLLGCDTCHFRLASNAVIDVPLVIAPQARFMLDVHYDPRGEVGHHYVSIVFRGDGAAVDSIVELNGYSIATSVDDDASDSTIMITPNPVADILFVRGMVHGATCTIIDLHGRVMLQSSDPSLNVSALPPGPYTLRVMQGGRVLTARFMVMR